MNAAPVKVHPIPLGVDCCYLLVGAGGQAVLIDAGMARQSRRFAHRLAEIDISPSQIGLLLITHCHWDHIGSARAIRDLTAAKVAVHSAEKSRLEHGAAVMPPGVTTWGRTFGRLVRLMGLLYPVQPCPVDIAVDDSGLDLSPYGIPGRVLHTPGHSPGSLTVLLDDGHAFVGDLAMNGPPLRFGPGLPIFAEQPERLASSWRTVLDAGARTIHPAHGKPFPAEVMRLAVSYR